MNKLHTTITPAKFRAKAERMFRDANPDAVRAGLSIGWRFVGPVTTDASGNPARFGHFYAVAPGHFARLIFVSANADGTGMSVR